MLPGIGNSESAMAQWLKPAPKQVDAGSTPPPLVPLQMRGCQVAKNVWRWVAGIWYFVFRHIYANLWLNRN